MGWHAKWNLFAILSAFLAYLWFNDYQISIVMGVAMIIVINSRYA